VPQSPFDAAAFVSECNLTRGGQTCLTCSRPEVAERVREILRAQLDAGVRRVTQTVLRAHLCESLNYRGTSGALGNHLRGCEAELHQSVMALPHG